MNKKNTSKNYSKNLEFKIKNTGKYGKGVFALENIKKGRIIKILSGEIISFDECIKRIKKGKERQSDSLQVGLELDMDFDTLSNTFNHSCNPNAGIRKTSELFALRNIKKGEEITYDYSATIGPNIPLSLWSMRCKCGAKNCRKIVGNVLTIPDKILQKYKKLGALQDYMKVELKKIKKDKNGKYLLPKYKKIIIK
jgi:uncharacterized protein